MEFTNTSKFILIIFTIQQTPAFSAHQLLIPVALRRHNTLKLYNAPTAEAVPTDASPELLVCILNRI